MTHPINAVLRDKTTWALVLIGVLVIGVAALLFRATQPPAVSPIIYQRWAYDSRSACAGQSVSYTVHVDILSAPTVLTSAESWWSVDRQFTAIVGDRFTSAIYTEPVSITRVTSITVPLKLAPGRYEYRRAAYADNAPPAIYTVPFTVTSVGCKSTTTG